MDHLEINHDIPNCNVTAIKIPISNEASTLNVLFGLQQTFCRRAGKSRQFALVKFIYSEKATKFCKIFPLLLTTVHTVKSKGKISQNFVAFSEYMNFTINFNNSFVLMVHWLDQTSIIYECCCAPKTSPGWNPFATYVKDIILRSTKTQ